MEKKNKWEIAFWCSTITSIVLLIFVICFSMYWFVRLANEYDDYKYDIRDKNSLITIINDTDFSKNEIIKTLEEKKYHYVIIGNEVCLHTINLIFENDKLQKIIE